MKVISRAIVSGVMIGGLLALTGCAPFRQKVEDNDAAKDVPAAMKPKDLFTPPGPNIALHKPYTLSPPPNYAYCTDPGDATQLTDGEYSVGPFWMQKTTVGWNRSPAQITIDLGTVEPIAGVSYSTAAGTAGVAWPINVSILVSDDGIMWSYLGDLIRMTTKQGGPRLRTDVYGTYRFVTGELKGSGRYVKLVADHVMYTFVDEIEVYQGPQTLLTQANPGPKTADPEQVFRQKRVFNAVSARLWSDLNAAREAINAAKLPANEKTDLLARADKLSAAVEAMPETVPDDFRAILPLNETDAAIYALNAPLLRARGYKGLTPWMGNRWDNLQPTEAPQQAPGKAPSLLVQMMGNEYRAEAFNLTNPNDKELKLTISITGFPGGKNPAYVSPREVLFTDSLQRMPIAAALPPAAVTPRGYRIAIPAGMTRQVWLAFHPTDVKPGTYSGEVRINGDGTGKDLVLPLTLQLYPFNFPAQPSIAIGGWDYLDGTGAYDAEHTPQPELIRNLREHFVNTPWASGSVAPGNLKFDPDGSLAGIPDLTKWDAWVVKWPDARNYAVFMNVSESFSGEKMGTPRFSRMVGEWITAWVAHMNGQGIKPRQLMLLLVDEPSQAKQDEIILAWTKAIRTAQPEVVIWEDPVHDDPYKANQEMLSSCTVLCPPRAQFINGPQSYRDYFLAQQKAGRELAFYSCSAGKEADPIAYHRGQFWSAIKYNAKGSTYWAFGDEGGSGNSWNPYRAKGNGYAPMFIGPDGTTDGKHMEAIREGAEDYEYFQMLQKRVAELEGKGVQSPVLAQAKTFLTTAPDEAVMDVDASSNPSWNQPRDRGRMDKARVQALDLMVKLSKL